MTESTDKGHNGGLRECEAVCLKIVEQINEVIFEINADARWTFLNDAWTRLTGYRVDDCLGQSFLDVIAVTNQERGAQLFRQAITGAQIGEHREVDVIAKSGEILTLDLRMRVVRQNDSVNVVGTLRDVTNRKRIERKLADQHTFLRRIIDAQPNPIFVVDGDGVFRLVNRSMAELYGWPADEIIGKREADIQQESAVKACGTAQTDQLSEEISTTNVNGLVRWLRIARQTVYSPDTGQHFTLGVLTDITERKALEQQIEFHSLHDALTSLPNRTLLVDRLDRSLAALSRTKRRNAVILLALDNFKVIKDAIGHTAGDQLLVQFSERLKNCIRPGDTAARMGGDEFAILLEDLDSDSEAVHIAERLTKWLIRPVALSGRDLVPSISIGIAIGHSGTTSDALLGNAGTAIFQAKTTGKASYVLFADGMAAKAVERLDLEADLRKAIENGLIELHYQPIIDTKTLSVSEVEALARWNHPTRGAIPPSSFIPIAEETGLIIPLGIWAIREACRCLNDAGSPNVNAAVNVSLIQLRQPDFVDQVAAILQETAMAANRLKIEITETVMMSDVEAMVDTCRNLKRLGVSIAIDDFGTGYSSIAYLLRLPVDTLKIDRFFINLIGGSLEDQVIVRSIVGMAKSLGMKITSEGVETEQQFSTLAELGVDHMQGYFIARPQKSIDAAVNWTRPR